jgi:hypothetical protein
MGGCIKFDFLEKKRSFVGGKSLVKDFGKFMT